MCSGFVWCKLRKLLFLPITSYTCCTCAGKERQVPLWPQIMEKTARLMLQRGWRKSLVRKVFAVQAADGYTYGLYSAVYCGAMLDLLRDYQCLSFLIHYLVYECSWYLIMIWQHYLLYVWCARKIPFAECFIFPHSILEKGASAGSLKFNSFHLFPNFTDMLPPWVTLASLHNVSLLMLTVQ